VCKVKCAECGFLSMRGEKTLEEVELRFRSGVGSPDLEPLCFVLAFNLGDELRNAKNALPPSNSPTTGARTEKSMKDDRDANLGVITKDRPCLSFVKWVQGFSPKEHKEMVFHIELQKMQQEQREKDIAREEQRLRDAERQRKEDLEWRAEQDRKTEERWRSENKLQKYSLIIIGIIGTVILAGAQIVGSLIQVGWFK
jgi:flagellar motility protein MotE (MotC chaperone)